MEIEILFEENYLSDYKKATELSFYCPKPDKTEKAPALPTLPRGIAFGQDVKTVMEKLGFDQSFMDQYADEGSVTLYLTDLESDIWVSEADPEYDSFYFSIDYDTSDWGGRISFDFWEGALEGYRITSSR